jgi:YVTN family beta-propeller protein
MVDCNLDSGRRVSKIPSWRRARGLLAALSLATLLLPACTEGNSAGEAPWEQTRLAVLEVSDPNTSLAVKLPAMADPVLAGLTVPATAPLRGMWSATQTWPLNGLHSVLLPNGRVLTYGTPTGNAATQDGRYFDVWDPGQGFVGVSHRTSFSAQQVNSFCSGAAFLGDGRLLVSGGNSPLDSSLFASATGAISTASTRLADDRWYGSMITLADGRLLMLGGSTPYGALRAYQDPAQAINAGTISMTPEIFEPSTGFRSLFGATSRDAFGPDHHRYWYPRAWVAPNGEVFGISSEKMWYLSYEGEGAVRIVGNFKTGVSATTRPNIGPTSTAVMYAPGRILQVGGNGYYDGHGTPGSALATTVDIRGATPVLAETAPMSAARQWANAIVLPDGRVAVTGGTRYGNNGGADAVYEAELWDPALGTWVVGARAAQIRVYHSAALLLPNGTVLSTGGGAPGPVNNLNAEIYYPPYLFRAIPGGGAELAPRPGLVAVNSLSLTYGATLEADLASSVALSKVVLLATGSVTHSFDTSQRRLELPFVRAGNRIAVEMPTSANAAPPGYYQLFVIDSAGVPSTGVILALGPGTVAPPVPTLLPRGNRITLASQNLPEYAIGTDATTLGVLELLGATPTPADLASATFIVRDGLADSNCVSLESIATPGSYLRHAGYRLRLGTNDGADGFKNDATFCPELGLASTGITLRSKNFPTRVLRHRNAELWIDPVVTEGTFAADATFTLRAEALPPLPAVPAPIVPTFVNANYSLGTGTPGIEYSFDFGDGSPPTGYSAATAASHAFSAPGLYLVTVIARSADGRSVTKTFVQAVHAPLAAGTARASSAVAIEPRNGSPERIWVTNPDNDSVSVFDSATLTRVAEVPVGASPRSLAVAPDGRIWATNREGARVSILDPVALSLVNTLELRRGTRPHGLVFSASAAFVSLEGSGELLELDAVSGALRRTLDVGAHARGLALTGDGARLLVSRFITPPLAGESTALPDTLAGGGEVVVVDPVAWSVRSGILLAPSLRDDGSVEGRGVPNYLGAPVVSPDGFSAWVPSKQDNVARGSLRDGLNLDFQNTVRAVSSRIDLTSESENPAIRVDHDNAGVAAAGAFHPTGAYLFVALETSRQVAVVNASAGTELFRIEVGRAPQGLAVSSDGTRLYVQNFMDRSLSVIDLTPLVGFGEFRAPVLATMTSVGSERLAPTVLVGKQLFYDARDPRLARDAYLSCASCHADGGHDGRVWDFTGFGEGLRNTISLVGRGGGQGRLHFSANFDEVQDFEGQIRAFAAGTGLLPDAVYLAGTRSQPLGDPKAGLGVELDALALYVASLTSPSTSPYRDQGALTPDGVLGRELFVSRGCTSCHYGNTFSDESGAELRDIGTLKPSSGFRLSGPLEGIDVPSLRDAWNTAPYLHDGSAPDLASAIAAHDGIELTQAELASLVEFVRQIDQNEPGLPAAPTCADEIQNGSETGVDCGGTCAPCVVTCSPATYQAETMFHSTGGSTSGGWNIWANGYVSTPHTFSPGTVTLSVYARGSVAASVWPNMVVSVGGVTVGNATVNTTSYAPYQFVMTAAAGAAELRVQFTNDLNQNGQDRNLYVDRVEISCGGIIAPTCTDGAKNGSETDVDCGGSCASDCANGKACGVNADCVSGSCAAGTCQAPPVRTVTAAIVITHNWGSGYCANLNVTNAGNTAISTWTAQLDTKQSSITNWWNGTITGSGALRKVTPLDWNAALGPKGVATVGFCANITGSNFLPVVTQVSGS